MMYRNEEEFVRGQKTKLLHNGFKLEGMFK